MDKYLRRVLNQAPHAAKKKKSRHFQAVFRRLLPRLGYKPAIWTIAHRLCWKILHQEVRFVEQGSESDPKARKQRAARSLARALRKLGYDVAVTPINHLQPNRSCTEVILDGVESEFTPQLRLWVRVDGWGGWGYRPPALVACSPATSAAHPQPITSHRPEPALFRSCRL